MTSVLERFALHMPPTVRSATEVCGLSSPSGSADAFLALTLANRPSATGDPASLVFAITPGIPDAGRLADDLRLLAETKEVGALSTRILEFPPPLEDDRAALAARIRTVAAVKAWSLHPSPCVIIAPFHSLAARVPSGSVPALSLMPGSIPFADVCARLAELGYERASLVSEPGFYSVRGGIVDAWCPGEEFPVRAEFFGEDLESVRTFDAATQISVARLDSATLLPVSERGEIADDGPTMTLLDLLPTGSTLLAIEHGAYALHPLLGTRAPARTGLSVIYVGDPAPVGVPSSSLPMTPLPGFAELGAEEARHPELFDAARKRLDQHLRAAEARGDTIFRCDDLAGGFELPGLVVVTKADRVFTKHRSRIARRQRTFASGPRLSDFEDLEPGEYVVHVDHGIGRYVGSSEIVAEGRRSEVFTVEYADGAKLHVPAAHAHLLSRYVGVKGEAVKLHRLDGTRWTKDKQNAQRAVADLAAALLETQARRETVPGFAYDVHCEGIEAFEAAFPYDETPDQAAAIAAVKADLARTRPMDRLICGDAGYGKTEVAMRAAYIAAVNGRQVVLLAPTTVLAEQHFETFTSRFDGTPIRIESMSRFQSADTHAGTLRRLATGVCDIVIGTHAILSPKVAFRDLGLIVIDEEQRFGVRQKEFLKALRATADVLTLSATPIPRTLYLSMTGARDLSLLRTPPRERVAVDTKIVTDTDLVVRHAIEAELARGGQVFFLHNRVTTISKVERRLKALLPSIRIVVAHGQMDARTLARKMRDFESGAYDVLLSTTIIESGIDIPRANTILVDHAEAFGLADLYQLRGRVGRSSREGHAVFLIPTGGLVDPDARERLKALQRHGGLGAGFNLAVRDLELRGAGNLLGAQQSGHIAAVGFSLYCQLLQRTVAILRGEKVREVIDVRMNLDFAAPRIPYEYVEEDAIRMSLLRRFAEAQDVRVIRALGEEMADRFGPLPPEAREFLRAAELRVRCAQAKLGNLDVRDSRAVFYRNGTREVALVTQLKGKNTEAKLAELIRAVTSGLRPAKPSPRKGRSE